MIALSRADAGTTVTLRVGEALRVTLPANPTTGYRWDVDAAESRVLGVRGAEHHVTSVRAGAPGETEVAFVGAAPGTTTVRGALRRPWEVAGAAADSFSFTVVVAP